MQPLLFQNYNELKVVAITKKALINKALNAT